MTRGLCASSCIAVVLVAHAASAAGADGSGKPGPWMLAVDGGLAVGKDAVGPSFGHIESEAQGVVGLVAGWAPVLEHNGYLLFAAELAHGSISTDRTLAGGVEYDLPVAAGSAGALYVYGRALAGYTSDAHRYATARSFTLIPSIGAAYIAGRRLRLAVEPFDVALFQIGEVAAEARFRFLASAGVTF